MSILKPVAWIIFITLIVGIWCRPYSFGQTQNPIFSYTNTPLSDVLVDIKNEKQIAFLYEPETIKSVFISDQFDLSTDTKKILKTLLSPIGLKFKKIGKSNYIIKQTRRFTRNTEGLTSTSNQKFPASQKIEGTWNVTGVVRDLEDDEVLIGATVGIKNTNIGTVTNERGEFSLDIPQGEQELVISYIGFEEKSIVINKPNVHQIRLSSAFTELDEIIITAVGIESRKRILGYSADNIKHNVFNAPGETNFVSALSGKSAGVWINTASGMPGASASIFIRGLRSINGSNKPLFILDGVPIDNSTFGNGTGGVDVSNRMVDVNQHDIDEITILKGPSAAALYGIRAANGAVIMTSKKGIVGKPKIQFSSSFGWNKFNKLPERQLTYAQGRYKNGKAVYHGPESNVNSSYGPDIRSLEYDGDENYPYDNNGRLVLKGEGNGVEANIYDAYDALFINGLTFDNHLSFSGAKDWFNYYLSFGQLRETGIIPGSSFNRYTLRAAFEVLLHEKWTFGMSSNLVNSRGLRMKRGSLFSGVPLGLFRNPISFDIGNEKKGKNAANSPDAYIFENGEQRSFRGNGSYDNPFWSINRNPFEDKVNRLVQNVYSNYKINSWLNVSYKMGLDVYADKRISVFDINSGSHPNGQIDLFNIDASNINSDLLLTAEKNLGDEWTVRSTLGHNYFYSEFSLEEIKGEEFERQGVFNITNALNISSDQSVLRKKVAGLFADLHFRYKRILYVNLTGRNDWSSTLPKSNNSFFYPGAHVGLEFTELLGWTDEPHLSYGKLRFSVSKVGNDARSYLTDTYFRPAIVDGDDLLPDVEFPAFDISAFERSGVLGNAHLNPESTLAYEIGTDLRFLKGRVQVDATWYKTISKDQIVNAQVSAASGFLRTPTNAGTIKNRGVEFALQISPIKKANLRWDLTTHFSKFNSIVTDLPQNNSGIVLASFSSIASVILEGQPYGVFVGTSIERNVQGQRIIGEDGFPKVNNVQTVIGDPNPDYLLGFSNSIRWKNVTFDFNVDVRKGGDIWNGTRGVMSYLGVSKISGDQRETRGYVFQGVTQDGVRNTKKVDLANPENGMEGIYWRRYGFLGLSEDHIEDGSWIRLRQVGLTYQFSSKLLKESDATFAISLHANNLVLITDYTGVDPETNLRGDSNIVGWDYFTLPSTKGYSLSLTAIF